MADAEPHATPNSAARRIDRGLSRTDFAALFLGAILVAVLLGLMVSPQSMIVPGIILIHSGCRRFRNMGWNSWWGLLWMVPVFGAWALVCMPLSRPEAISFAAAVLVFGPALSVLCCFTRSNYSVLGKRGQAKIDKTQA
jgi:uncharacterized membrane protein YhaH (DUF805 family)